MLELSTNLSSLITILLRIRSMSYGGEAMFSLMEMILDGGISRCSGYECKMPQLRDRRDKAHSYGALDVNSGFCVGVT